MELSWTLPLQETLIMNARNSLRGPPPTHRGAIPLHMYNMTMPMPILPICHSTKSHTCTQVSKPKGYILQQDVQTNSISSAIGVHNHLRPNPGMWTQHMLELVKILCHNSIHPQGTHIKTQTLIYNPWPTKCPPTPLRRCECPPINPRGRKISAVDYNMRDLKAPTLPQLMASPWVELGKLHVGWKLHLHPLINMGWKLQTRIFNKETYRRHKCQ